LDKEFDVDKHDISHCPFGHILLLDLCVKESNQIQKRNAILI